MRCSCNIITSEFANRGASPSVKVVTELHLTTETMLQAGTNLITHKRHIPYQILIVRMPKSMACTSPCLLLSAAVYVCVCVCFALFLLNRFSCVDLQRCLSPTLRGRTDRNIPSRAENSVSSIYFRRAKETKMCRLVLIVLVLAAMVQLCSAASKVR